MHNDTWQLQEAKAHLSELVRACQHAPQKITVRGQKEAVVLSHEEYEKLTQKPRKGKEMTLGEFFRASPLYKSGIKLDIRRAKGKARDIDFD